MEQRKWTREEEIIVFNLYCKIPFKKSSKNNPKVIEIAKIINRSPSSVNMKIGNFGSFDENLKKKGIVGLVNASKLDEQIWNEFNGDWDRLSYESERLIEDIKDISKLSIDIPEGKEKETIIKQRLNQSFFRQTVLASYNNTCCITGINTEKLLVASHIKPWAKSDGVAKTNPRNGLCLNALHDKAFDQGLITVTPDYTIHVSSEISDIYNGEIVRKYFDVYDGNKITLPDKFIPDVIFLQYHNDVIYENWR